MASPLPSQSEAKRLLDKEKVVPPLTRDSVLRAVKGVRDLNLLRLGLRISHESWQEIDGQQRSHDDKLKAVVEAFVTNKSRLLWRRVIRALDLAGETSAADCIIHNAEPLADPTLTEENVTTVMRVVRDWRRLGCPFLLFSQARLEVIEQAYSSHEDRASVTGCHWIKTSTVVSWQELACKLYLCGEDRAVEAVKKFLPERDPSLTTDKLMEIFSGNEKNWEDLGSLLNIPDSKRAEISDLYQRDKERLRALLSHWVHIYPCPSWGDVVTALQYVSGDEAAESVREKYVKATEKSKMLFRKAMESGYVLATDHNVLFLGFAGNGKTHTMYLLLNKDPPPERTSTPCAKAPVRIVSTSRTRDDENEWIPIQRSELLQLVAESSVVFQQNEEGERTPQEDSHTQQPAPDQSQASPTHPTPHSFQPTELTTSHPISTEVQRKADIREDIYGRIDTCYLLKPVKVISWINLVDSGGQPQFHEVLPTFIRNRAACLLVLKLSESLEHHPMVELYKRDKLIGSYRSPLSHLQTLQYCIRTVQSQISRGGESPLIAFIGTHKDLEYECKTESRSDKNRKLREILPADKSNILLVGKDLIVGLNTKSPGPHDKKLATDLRRWVLKYSPAKPVKIPLQYYGLECALQDMMKEEKRGVFHKGECRAVAETLFFTDESFDAALTYLTHLNVIFYYKSILPNVVFVSSQVLLDKLNELVSFYYQYLTVDLTDGIEEKFREQALVTLELLKKERFTSHYIEGLFGPEELIRLLESEELLLLAKVSDKEYLLPCTLPTVDKEEIFQCSSSSVPPLLVFFPQGGPRLGVFCRLIAYLLTIAKWKLLFRDHTPVEVTRNSIAFSLPGNLPGRVTIRDPFSSFFVVTIKTKFANTLPEVCPRIRATIHDGIQHVSGILDYTDSIPTDAFFCSEGGSGCRSSPHPATVVPGCVRELLMCTINPEEGRTITKEEHIWFLRATSQAVSDASPGASTATASPALDISTVTEYLLDLDKSEVYNLGISLGLSFRRVKSKFDSAHDTTVFLDEIISAWLKRVDQVDEQGGPSWETLVAALRSKRLKQTGIANNIEKDLS